MSTYTQAACYIIWSQAGVIPTYTWSLHIMILYQAARVYVGIYSGRLMLYYIKPRVIQTYTWSLHIWYNISAQSNPDIYLGASCYDIIWSAQSICPTYTLVAVMLYIIWQPRVICQDYSGRWCYILYEAARYMSGLLWSLSCYDHYMKPGCNPDIIPEAASGICRDYSGLWCYDIIRSDQVYVGITQGCDVMTL